MVKKEVLTPSYMLVSHVTVIITKLNRGIGLEHVGWILRRLLPQGRFVSVWGLVPAHVHVKMCRLGKVDEKECCLFPRVLFL